MATARQWNSLTTMKLNNFRFNLMLPMPPKSLLLSKIIASASYLGAEFLLRLSQSPRAHTLVNLSLWCSIAPFEIDIVKQMEVFPVLR